MSLQNQIFHFGLINEYRFFWKAQINMERSLFFIIFYGKKFSVVFLTSIQRSGINFKINFPLTKDPIKLSFGVGTCLYCPLIEPSSPYLMLYNKVLHHMHIFFKLLWTNLAYASSLISKFLFFKKLRGERCWGTGPNIVLVGIKTIF